MKQRIKSLLTGLCTGLYEREEALSLSLLSALAGESIFLLGLPGVGKSLVARRLKSAFQGARSFEYLMSRFSTPDEIFGPVSITKLKESDLYERITKGYLPESEIVFLDEIWKAGPAIQNSLLTVLNEKVYLNGTRLMPLPIKGIISASNELPAEGEGLEALWDRFVIRYVVEPISKRSHFESLICNVDDMDEPDVQPLTEEECHAITKQKGEVKIPKAIVDVIYNIRSRLHDMLDNPDDTTDQSETKDLKYYISDRRWKKAVGIMKTSAVLNGRTELDFSDILLLAHILWNDDTQICEILNIVCEEVVGKLFKMMLDTKKSPKRHAVKSQKEAINSPDGVHYVVLCDGFSLKIRIDDYKNLLATGDYRFGSETADGRLVLTERGSYAVQVKEAGKININGYSYQLATSVEKQMSNENLNEMTASFEDMLTSSLQGSSVLNHGDVSSGLLKQVSENMFVSDQRFMPLLRRVISIYTNKK